MRKDKDNYVNDTEFSRRLRQAMRERETDIKALANAVYIETASIKKYRTGVNTPGADIIASICRVLDVSADYLLGLTDEMKQLTGSK